MRQLPRATIVVFLVFAAACHDTISRPPATVTASSTPLEARREQLRALLADEWEYTMRTNPEYASLLGDKRYNDRWNDRSETAVQADLEAKRRYLARLEAIDTAGFPVQEQLNKALLVRDLGLTLEGARFETWLMPVSQQYGPHLELPQLVSILSFASVKDYDDYIARLRTARTVIDQTIALMRGGMAKGLMPPKILLGKIADQAELVATSDPEASPFAVPLKSFPAAMADVDRARIRTAVLAAIRETLTPSYRSFAAFVRAEYEPRGRAEVGVWSLPLGEERYAFSIKEETSTKMTAEQIHELGRKEVARVEAQMTAVAAKLGYADIHALGAANETNTALHFASRQAVVDLYRKYTDQMYAKLPTLFGRLPNAKVEILPVEEFREKDGPGAEYEDGAADGSRPGHVMVNTGEFAKRSTTDVETTAYHEGVPGHHLQISIAQEVTGLPPFRQHYSVTAYVEGWALYAERLGEEVGLYQDPYSSYGHLEAEMLRAIRLVVDTGLHAKRWSRQQVIDFFHAHSTISEVEVQSETDRYIANPGQALAYKVGQLRILELREKAKRALGDKFDLRGFHDTVLGAGALPLDVLGEQIDRWIAARKAA